MLRYSRERKELGLTKSLNLDIAGVQALERVRISVSVVVDKPHCYDERLPKWIEYAVWCKDGLVGCVVHMQLIISELSTRRSSAWITWSRVTELLSDCWSPM